MKFVSLNNQQSLAQNNELSLPRSYNEVGVDAPNIENQAGVFDALSGISEFGKTVDGVSSLIGMFESFKTAISYGGSDSGKFADNFVARFEDLSALIVGLASSNSVNNTISLLLLYGRTMYTKSFTLSMQRFVLAQFSDVLSKQSGDEFVNMYDNFSTNPMRRGLSAILSVLLVAGLLPDHESSKSAFHIYDLFGVRVSRHTCGASSFVELVFETFRYVLEHALPAIEAKDLSLLWTTADLTTLDDQYNSVVSAKELLESGNISQLPQFVGVDSDQDYLDILYDVRHKLQELRSKTRNPSSVTVINSKLLVLSKIETSLFLAWKKAPIREKPLGLLYHGKSGVNKTTVYELTNRAVCHANGIKCDRNTNCSLNGDDKYQSEMNPRIQSVLFDDVMNTNPQYLDANPLTKFLQFLNNAHCNALNAQADKKGLMAINCKLVHVTTNRPDLGAYIYSCEPASILRRFELHVKVSIKPDCVDPSTGMAFPHLLSAALPDCWHLQVFQPKIVRRADGVPDGLEMCLVLDTLSIVEYLDFVKTYSRAHFAMQKRMVNLAADRENELWCPTHCFPASTCPHCEGCKPLSCGHEKSYLMNSGQCAMCELQPWVNSEKVYSVEEYLAESAAETYVNDLDALEKLSGPLVNQAGGCVDEEEWEDLPKKQWWEETVYDMRAAAHSVARVISEQRTAISTTIMVSASLGIMCAFVQFACNAIALQKATPQEGPCRLGADLLREKPVMWKRPDYVPDSRPLASKTTTVESLEQIIVRSLAFVRYWNHADPGVVKTCNALPYRGNVWILPSHIFDIGPDVVLQCRLPQGNQQERVFSQRLTFEMCAKVDDSDLVLVSLPGSGSMPDFSRFIRRAGDRSPKSSFMKGMWNNRGISELHDLCSLQQSQVSVSDVVYTGLLYNMDIPTQLGFCGMVVYEDSKQPTILGVHTAGRSGTPFGVASLLIFDSCERAFAQLPRERLVQQSSGPLCERMYNINIEYNAPIPGKNPVNFISGDVDRNLQIVGSHGRGTARMKSRVRVSPVSPVVESVMGLPRLHCPPQTRQQWRSPQRILDKLTACKPPLNPIILEVAYHDLLESSSPWFKRAGSLQPLDYVTAINGLDGVRGFDRMDCTTSCGYPINKPKGAIMVDLGSDGNRVVVRDFDTAKADVLAECERKESLILSGQRANFIYQSALKDEGVSFKKFQDGKNRVFQCCEVAAVVLFRKYFLPLLVVEQRYGLQLESGVGINAASPEFGELFEHLAEFGTERCFAGDYAGFDTSIPLEVTHYTYAYYLHFAQLAGYSDRDLTIMRGLCTEAMFPLVEYFGAWLFLPGLTPSGIPLTVHKNNNDNRLLMRYAFFARNSANSRFVDHIRLVCYGDDNIVSVREGVRFDHCLVAESLATIGVEYTSADKSSDIIPYVSIWELEFLKRTFRKDPELGVVGYLDEKSISKSLHLYRDNPKCLLTVPQLIAQSFESAAREWFLYGRDIYDRRVAEMLRVAETPVDGHIPRKYVRFKTYDELKDSFFSYKLWN